MRDLQEIKDAARKAAFARRKAAHSAGGTGRAALLSEVQQTTPPVSPN